MSAISTTTDIDALIASLNRRKQQLINGAIQNAANELADNYAIPFAIDALVSICQSQQHANGEIWLTPDLECHDSWLMASGLLTKQMYWIGLDGDLQAMSADEYKDFSEPVDGQYTDYDYGYAITRDKFFDSITHSYVATPLFSDVLDRYLKAVA